MLKPVGHLIECYALNNNIYRLSDIGITQLFLEMNYECRSPNKRIKGSCPYHWYWCICHSIKNVIECRIKDLKKVVDLHNHSSIIDTTSTNKSEYIP